MSPFGFHTRAEEVVDVFAAQVKGRTFLITGTSEKGLGAYTAITLARAAPAQLILLSRNKSKVDPVIREIASINPAIKTTLVQVDLSDQDSVRAAADRILKDNSVPHIDVAINNAGVMYVKKYTTDKAGNELQFSANHIGHFLLTNLLLPKILAAGPGARIVNLTSHGHRISDIRWDDLAFDGGRTYDGWTGYGQSKTANVLFSVELAKRLRDRGVAVLAVHPGGIAETSLGSHLSLEDFDIDPIARRNTGRGFQIDSPFKNTSEGTSSTVAAALDPELGTHSGAYVQDCQVGDPYGYAVDGESAKRLWSVSEGLVGQKFDL